MLCSYYRHMLGGHCTAIICNVIQMRMKKEHVKRFKRRRTAGTREIQLLSTSSRSVPVSLGSTSLGSAGVRFKRNDTLITICLHPVCASYSFHPQHESGHAAMLSSASITTGISQKRVMSNAGAHATFLCFFLPRFAVFL
jgi:hypothetical protein